MLVAPHNVGGPVLTAASLQVAACTPELQDPGALQRLRRRGDQEGASRAPRRSWTATSQLSARARPRRRAGRRRGGRVPAAAGPLRPVGRGLGAAQARRATRSEHAPVVDRRRPGEHRLVAARAARPRRAGRGAGRGSHAVGHLRQRPRGATRATGPRGTSATPSPPATSGPGRSRRSAPGVARGAGRPQGRRRGLPQLPGAATAATRARPRCARRGYEETGFTQPGAMADHPDAARPAAARRCPTTPT